MIGARQYKQVELPNANDKKRNSPKRNDNTRSNGTLWTTTNSVLADEGF